MERLGLKDEAIRTVDVAALKKGQLSDEHFPSINEGGDTAASSGLKVLRGAHFETPVFRASDDGRGERVLALLFHALMAPEGLPLALVVAVLWCVAAYSVRPAFAGIFSSGLRFEPGKIAATLRIGSLAQYLAKFLSGGCHVAFCGAGNADGHRFRRSRDRAVKQTFASHEFENRD